LVLNRYRSLADPFLDPLARRLIGVGPDALTWIAFLFAIVAGASFWYGGEHGNVFLLLALVAILLNGLLDALDGWVARLSGLASRRGDFLDHVLDRYADAFIIGGIVLSAYCHFTVGLLAILGVIFTSYMGTQAMALGLKRDYGGILGRADRLVLLIVATLAQWAWTAYSGDIEVATLDIAGDAYQLTILEILLIWFAVAGHLTAMQRGIASWKDLSKEVDGEDTSERSEAVTVEVEDPAAAERSDGTEKDESDGEDEEEPSEPSE
jgi:archaetidylinositol phosphate synthase